MDRISELPEPILEYILSFLVYKNVAQLSILSKTWNKVCNSISYLKFGGDFFFTPSKYKPKLVDVVHQTLENRRKLKIAVHKCWLQLPLPLTIGSHEVYNCWIDTLVVCNIKELHLSIKSHLYKLPEMIFNAKALNVLRLIGFNIIELPCKSINLPSLREFYLDSVILDDNFLRAICTTCSNLEVLYLVGCHGFNRLQVGENLPKLKKLKLGYSYHQVQFVDISSTNLEQLTIYGNCDYLKTVEITVSKALKTLYLQRVPITQKILSCLGNLDKCELFFCHTLKTLKIASFLLKQLTVHQCPNLIAVELDTPNLIRFSYNCHSLPTLQLKASASASLEAKICFVSGTTDSDVTKFLSNFNQSMVVELTCKSDKALVIPKDMRGNLLPPLYGTNRVHVNIRSPLINCSIVDILDSMLWISPQLDTLSYFKPDLKILMFIYEDALDEDEKPCCTSQPWKCWRHKLKQVKIQNITCMEQKQELRNYLYANPDIPEIIEVPGPVFIDPTVFIHRFVIE